MNTGWWKGMILLAVCFVAGCASQVKIHPMLPKNSDAQQAHSELIVYRPLYVHAIDNESTIGETKLLNVFKITPGVHTIQASHYSYSINTVGYGTDTKTTTQSTTYTDGVALIALNAKPGRRYLLQAKVIKRNHEDLLEFFIEEIFPIHLKTLDDHFDIHTEITAYDHMKRLGTAYQVIISGDNREKVYQTVFNRDMAFSNDGKRFAFYCESGNEPVMVVDGKETPCGEQGGRSKYLYDARTPVFSPDSKRIAHRLVENGKQCVVVDGKKGSSYGLIGKIVFSPDCKRLAYRAAKGEKWVVVIDGKEGKGFDKGNWLFSSGIYGPIVFSPDSRQVAHIAIQGEEKTAVIDGKPGRPYKSISDLVFSPDSANYAYVARSAGSLFPGQSILVVNGNEIYTSEPELPGIERLHFSEDSRSVEFWACPGNRLLNCKEISVPLSN